MRRRAARSFFSVAHPTWCFSCAAIFGPLLSYGIGHVRSGINPYQGIFLFMGAVSLAFAPLVWYLLPNSPTTAKFLERGNDRLVAIERLRENNTGTKVRVQERSDSPLADGSPSLPNGNGRKSGRRSVISRRGCGP